MKTEKELNELREEVKGMKQKLAELSEDELKQVSGGVRQFNPYIAGVILTAVTPGVLVGTLDSQE